MKNLFILLASLIGISCFSQQKRFEGVWIENETGSVRTISITDTISIRNSHPSLNYDFEQRVIKSGKDFISTISYYEENDWTVYITYTLEDNDTLVAYYTGDYTGITKHKRKINN